MKMDDLSDELEKVLNGKKSQKEDSKKEKSKLSDIAVINTIYDNVSKVLSETKLNSIKGELISFKNSDCNAYITVKIGDYNINCTYWRIQYSDEYEDCRKIKEGDQVILKGSFTLSKRNLNIYFNIKSMSKVGVGDYLVLHKKYREKIIEDGMNLNKKVINVFPYRIGIITAAEGAAIQDILQTFKTDNFIGKIYIKNSIVQGKQCPQSVIDSIKYFETKNKKIDILLITRGGGSYEDLVGFSDWNLIEKIYNSRLNNNFIIISAVGHQIDNQLSDEVSDYKFATPSIAAKHIVETQQKYYESYYKLCDIIDSIKEKYVESKIKFELITSNLDKIIKKYDIYEIKENILKYSSIIKKIITNYNNCKNKFFNKLTNMKPTIFKKNIEIISISNFVNFETKKEVSPKKIEIVFPDGKVELSYKLLSYTSY
jgi:exodeoxyribonuclease VII large subunit